MSFSTGGHVVYMTEPNKNSSPHALQVANGSLTVFTEVPSSGADADAPLETTGTLFPEQVISGRIVG